VPPREHGCYAGSHREDSSGEVQIGLPLSELEHFFS